MKALWHALIIIGMAVLLLGTCRQQRQPQAPPPPNQSPSATPEE